MIAHQPAPRYRSYLLRFWQERRGSGGGPAVWRFSLEDPHTGARHGFATLEQLVVALKHEIEDTQEERMSQDDQAEETIRRLVERVQEGWNLNDGEAFAAPFADDADYVVVDGRYVRGREAIARGHQQIFDTIYKGSHNSATVLGVRFLRDDVAIVHVEWRLRVPHGDAVREARAFNTMVWNRDDGEWRIAAFHNTPIAAPGGQQA